MDIEAVLKQASEIILGKEDVLRKCLCCLLARGHVLIEDVPGVGKTTMAQVFATLLGLRLNRVQFTSDLLPADITGITTYSAQTRRFDFHPGPVFAEFVLADEINRASPKTQSALLEAMEERQVTVEGTSHPLPNPFFVIATQNQLQQTGTYPLPESQLDRFLMQLQLGYPDRSAEIRMLMGTNPRDRAQQVQALATTDDLLHWQQRVDKVHVSEPAAAYVQSLLAYSRDSGLFVHGLSPRTGIALVQAARAWALMRGSDHITPDDLQAVFADVANHRLRFNHRTEHDDASAADAILRQVPVVGV